MHFAIIARDSVAEGTLAKRMTFRDEHLERIHAMKAEGTIVDGGAILNQAGDMVGSVVLCEFPSRAALDVYIESEVYFRHGIWASLEILPFRRVQWR